MQAAPRTANVAAHKSVSQPPTGLLDPGSKLPSDEGECFLKWHPTAGEVTATLIPWRLHCAGKPGPRLSGSSPAKREANVRRACGKIRRQCRANSGRFLWTLTYAAEPALRRQVNEHVRRFFEDAQATFGRLWLVAVVEEGGRYGRFHVHVVANKFLGIERVRAAWGRGHVHVGDPERGVPRRVRTRHLAAYLAKYVAKQLDLVDEGDGRDRAFYGHRYFVTQGWEPLCLRRQFHALDDALAYLRAVYGQPDITYAWVSEDDPDICGVWNSYPDRVIRRWLSTA